MPDHAQGSANWMTRFYPQVPNEPTAWKRWMRRRTVGQMTTTAFVLRILQLVIEGLLCGLATWLILIVKPDSIAAYFWTAIWPGLAFLIVLLYLLPTTFSHVKAQKKTIIPFIIEAIAVVVWIVTWAVMRNDQMYRQCISERQCVIRIAYLGLGMLDLLLFTFLAYMYGISLMFPTTGIRGNASGHYDPSNFGIGIASPNRQEQEGEQMLHPQASHSFHTDGTANFQSSSADTTNWPIK